MKIDWNILIIIIALSLVTIAIALTRLGAWRS